MKRATPGLGKGLTALALILLLGALFYYLHNNPKPDKPSVDDLIVMEPVELTQDGSAVFSYGIVTDIAYSAFSVMDVQDFPLVFHFDDGYDQPAAISGGDFGREVFMGMIPDANDPAQACPMTFKNIVSYEIKGELEPISCVISLRVTIAIDETTLTQNTCPAEVTQYATLTGISMAPIFLAPQYPEGGITLSPASYKSSVAAYVLDYQSTAPGGTMTWSYTLDKIDLPKAHPCYAQYNP